MQIKTKWDLSPLYKSITDPKIEKDRKIVHREVYKFINKWKDRNDYLKDPKVLKIALNEMDTLLEKYGITGKEGLFWGLASALDENSPVLKAKSQQSTDFAMSIVNDIQFFSMRVSKIKESDQKKFLNYPGLAEYRYGLKKSFDSSKYLLSEAEEKIINLYSNPAYGKWVEMLSGFLAKEKSIILGNDGKKSKKNFSEIRSLATNSNKKIRRSAISALKKILEKHSDVAEVELNAILETKKIGDNLRGLARPDSDRHLGDGIETKTVDAMIEAVEKNFSTSKKYYRLKTKLSHENNLDYFERAHQYGKDNKKYSFKETLKIVDRAFNKIDKEFSEILKSYVENGQIDVYPKGGKSGGAFSVDVGIKNVPGYVLLNFTNKVRDISTLAHEMGHAINNEFIKKKQKSTNRDTPLATAEVASTFMEDFAMEELSCGSDDNEKLILLMNRLDDSIATIMLQVAGYRFEQELHKSYRERGFLSKEEINKLFSAHMSSYLGPTIDMKKGGEMGWVFWSHFRRPFYVYSYASGLLISKALQRKFREDPKFIKKIKEFLSAGTSDSPENIFKKMGINISDKKFWLEGLKEIEDDVKEAEKLAKKLGKI